MEKRYIFFKGLIDTLDLYTDEFVRIYKERGAECLVIDAAHIGSEMMRLKAFLLAPVTAVISFNNIGMHLEFEDGRNIWDRFQVPFFNIMMDHPFHYKKALDTAPEQMRLLCMDRNHVDYVRRFFPNIRSVEFFPHAGIRVHGNAKETSLYAGGIPAVKCKMDLLGDERIPIDGGKTDLLSDGRIPIDGSKTDFLYDRRIPIAERKIDLLYAGGLSRYAAEGLIPDLGRIREFDAFELVRNALERLIREPELTTEYVIEQCLDEIKLKFDHTRLGEIITELRFLDSFAVSYYREQMVRSLAESGITVTVFGAGWDRCEWDCQNVVYGGVIPAAQILELMNQSKIVLNTMTWFKRGAHDRIFNGMLAGAAVVSDISEYLLENFTDGMQMRYFSLKDMGRLAETVKDLLGNPKAAQEMADCGYQSALEHHMWKNRLSEIRIL